MKNILLKKFIMFFMFLNCYTLPAEEFLDYPLSYIIEACEITKQRLSLENESEEKISKNREKYKTCMNFIMSLSTTLSERCISAKKEDIMPENSMTYADLSILSSTQELIDEVLNYSLKYPHFYNQIAWLHASKAISQKWPCKKNNF